MQLEIKVYEQVKVVDVIGDAIEFITETIKQWFASDTSVPLNITITKIRDRAPPVLGISVGESVEIKDRLV